MKHSGHHCAFIYALAYPNKSTCNLLIDSFMSSNSFSLVLYEQSKLPC